MRHLILVLVILFIVPYTAQAATIEGGVYDLFLEKTQGVIVEVGEQTLVSQNGMYSFDVSEGTYTITAEEMQGPSVVSRAEEQVVVSENITYRVDLILFPTFEQEQDIISETEGMSPSLPGNGADYSLFLLAGVIAAIVMLVLIFWKLKSLKPIREAPLPADLERIVKITKKAGGRITQRELRTEIDLSEAKISLMIADLEDRKIIKKVKKGRGNIIILESR